MDYAFSEREQRFRREVRDWLAHEWGPADATAGRMPPHDRERERAFRRKVAERGWLTMGWPPEYGGADLSPTEIYILSTEMSRAGAPFPLYVSRVIGPLILKYCTSEAQAELMPRIRTGEANFVLGFTEPETGSDLANLHTRAIRQADGYIVNGQKLYGRPDLGDIMYLAVRTDPDAPVRNGISILLVDYPTDGMTATAMPTLAGSSVGATFYDDVFVPRTRLLGEENRGWDYIREALDLDRAGGIPFSHFPVLYDSLLQYARTTTVDGAPLSADPWVQDTLARLAIEVEGAQLIQDVTAAKIAAGLKIRSESSIVKTFCTELESRLAAFGMELLGPQAPVVTGEGTDALGEAVNFLYRLNVAMTIVGGTNEIQRNIIALQGLGLPR